MQGHIGLQQRLSRRSRTAALAAGLLLVAILPVRADPSLQLDEAHNTWRADVMLSSKDHGYRVGPGSSLTIDCSNYIAGGSGLHGRPPANFLYVQVQHGSRRTHFKLEVPGDHPLVIASPDKAEPIDWKGPFTGFAPGDGLMIAIGLKSGDDFNSYLLSPGLVTDAPSAPPPAAPARH